MSSSASPLFNVLRFVVVLAVVVSAGIWIFNSFVSTKSYKGYVNGKIVHLRPPIKGTLKMDYREVGEPVKSGELLGTVSNPRAVELEGEQRFLSQKVEIARKQIEEFERLIAAREARLARFRGESGQQEMMRVAYERQNVSVTNGLVNEALSKMQQAQKDAERYARLAEKGYASQQQAELKQMEAVQAKTDYENKKAKLLADETKLSAAKAGFQVDSALSQNGTEQQVLGLESQLLDLRQRKAALEAEYETSKKMLEHLEKSNQVLRKHQLISPVDGVLWYIGAHDQEFVSENSNVMDVLDCDHLWVDTYIDEQKLKALDVTQPVKIKILSHPELKDVTGRIIITRAGVGRVSSHEGVALPNERERSHALVRIVVDWPQKPDPMQSCYVGSSVETEFAKNPWWENMFKLSEV